MSAPSYEVAIYNADQKELVGVFKDCKTCSKYIYEGTSVTYEKAKPYDNIKKKCAITGTRFDFRVVIRVANTEQRALLNAGHKAAIHRKYPRSLNKDILVIN